jgi:hypothetical protein
VADGLVGKEVLDEVVAREHTIESPVSDAEVQREI